MLDERRAAPVRARVLRAPRYAQMLMLRRVTRARRQHDARVMRVI